MLPNPNGYPILLKAGQSVIKHPDGISPSDQEGLRDWVATNSQALRLLRVGLSHPCAVDTEALLANFANSYKDLIALKSLALALADEGHLAEMENRPADAARSYLDAIRLGNGMSHGGFMINRLVGIACESIGGARFAKLLPKLDCAQNRSLIAELEKIDQTTVSWDEVILNENRFARSSIGNSANPLKMIQELWQARAGRRESAQRHDLAAAHLRLLMVELALRAYRCDQGQSPSSLISLVPKYLHSMPKDPFSGQDIAFRASGTNWVLYSLGPDGVDDGGKPVGKIITGNYMFGLGTSNSGLEENKGDLFFDSPW